MTAFIPSPQQQGFFDWITDAQGSAILEAVAGSGKTTTLLEGIERMPGTVAFAAYNKKIADEIKAKLEKRGADPQRVRAGTFHSFGFAAWRKVAPTVRVDQYKVSNLIQQRPEIPELFKPFIQQAVSLAKQAGFGILCPMEDRPNWWALVEHYDLEEELADDTTFLDERLVEQAIDHSIAILRLSIAQDREVIDFDDMLFSPLLHGARVWQYDWVLVDEAQDTNATRRAFARRMLKAGGRLVAVGDSRQAIYGFTGADSDAMDLIAKEFNAVPLPLTVSYRCPQAVVRTAQRWVSHIEAHPDAPEGISTTLTAEQFVAQWPSLTADDAILCRNTRPLIELAYSLIRKHIPCHVEGRDIGTGLRKLALRWKIKKLTTLRERLGAYLERETAKLIAKGQETKAGALQDKVETLFALMDGLPSDATLSTLVVTIDQMFEDSDKQAKPTLTLSTVHKAKGREWNRVYWYGANRYQPSPFARQAWQLVQEDNLCYVASTRAKQELWQVLVPAKEAR